MASFPPEGGPPEMASFPGSGRRDFLSSLVLGGASLPLLASQEHLAPPPRTGGEVDVTDFGAVGDGETPSAEGFQAAIDAAEARGGGWVLVPPGTFILERTPLIASRVHLRGAGASTVLRGTRKGGYRGSALISNKGQHAAGYGGAHDWAVSHLAIDSPDTNGIVVTHARNVYIGHIHGVNTYNHFIDTVGENVLCEHLFLTGRSGTSSFQIDSLSGAQTIWDGTQPVPPLYDDTDSHNVILRSSVITAVAGHEGDDEKHFVSIHFHGDDAGSFLFSDLIIGGSRFGFFQDENSRYRNIRIRNVLSSNPEYAAWFGSGERGQRGLSIGGLTHEPAPASRAPAGQCSIYIYGKDAVQLSDLRLIHPSGAPTQAAVEAEACRGLVLSNSILQGEGGTGLTWASGESEELLVSGCLFRGLETGIAVAGMSSPPPTLESLNHFADTGSPVQSTLQGDLP